MIPMPLVQSVLLVVCDGLGIGDAPDAAVHGDQGSNTIGNCARAAGGIRAPHLARMGLGCLTEIAGVDCAPCPGTAHGRLVERSAAKDSITGHWEISGAIMDRGFPLYPKGFPSEVIGKFEREIGRGVLGNKAASGTGIIAELGEEHLRSGRPIVYTSGDSVFQIACHEDVADLETLYQWAGLARGLLTGEHEVGRVIARPFVGTPGHFSRTSDRRDFSVPPPPNTLLDRCAEVGVAVYGVGKIGDVFSMRGLTDSVYSTSDDDGVDKAIEFLARPGPATLVFANLVDLDSKYGHRNDPEGFARCVEAFDRRVPDLLAAIDGGVIFITGDHGCDPTTPSTDHSREMVPMLVAGLDPSVGPVDVGTRGTFADLGATIAELLGVPTPGYAGESFARQLFTD